MPNSVGKNLWICVSPLAPKSPMLILSSYTGTSVKVEINPTTILTSTRAEEAAMSGVGSPGAQFFSPSSI